MFKTYFVLFVLPIIILGIAFGVFYISKSKEN